MIRTEIIGIPGAGKSHLCYQLLRKDTTVRIADPRTIAMLNVSKGLVSKPLFGTTCLLNSIGKLGIKINQNKNVLAFSNNYPEIIKWITEILGKRAKSNANYNSASNLALSNLQWLRAIGIFQEFDHYEDSRNILFDDSIIQRATTSLSITYLGKKIPDAEIDFLASILDGLFNQVGRLNCNAQVAFRRMNSRVRGPPKYFSSLSAKKTLLHLDELNQIQDELLKMFKKTKVVNVVD